MPAEANILVIDDDASIRVGSEQALARAGYRTRTATSGERGLQLCREESFDVAIVDLHMPGLGGLEVLRKIKEENPNTSVIVITGHATVESAVEAMRLGAYDFLPKPVTPGALAAIVKRALERRRLALESLCLELALDEKPGPDTMVGTSPAMLIVARLIQKVAPSDATVLVSGETGAGKELVARAIHRHSLRREQPFVTVDCGSLVDSLIEGELFGQARGAHGGATEAATGKFAQANGGTIFLDEIGNIGPAVQVKILRVIQERRLQRVGSSQTTPVDVRIIAATNRDLEKETKAGAFREELFYRLSVVPIHIPPLRDRREDIRILAQHFLRRYGPRRNPRVTGFSAAALRSLELHDWPGNVRELENAVERALVLAEGDLILPGDLVPQGLAPPSQRGRRAAGHLAEAERREIADALGRFGWRIGKTAEFLGIHRKTLREKIQRYGLAIARRARGKPKKSG
ncbi:MAG: sigma-54-dependent Fis family transcriptional regulator [Deltaproteobacteria bacterium]|nr:sigma-54-dependent Fis family transcriptional regulator [Deltaproteobacteria bacterium]